VAWKFIVVSKKHCCHVQADELAKVVCPKTKSAAVKKVIEHL
jgi:hypothetical protein